MRRKFLVLTVKKLLKSVYICGSYRKIKTGLSFFLEHPVCLTLSTRAGISVATAEEGAKGTVKTTKRVFLTAENGD